MLPERCPVVLTGATGGIGHEIASELARTGIDMILPCRNEAKFHALEQTLKAINPSVSLQFIPLDLNRADSVREAAAMLKDTPLAGVLNNAGIMCRSFTLSPDGPETTLNVNYFNTRLLNELLLEQVKPRGALVFTTSLTRLFGKKKNLPGDSHRRNLQSARHLRAVEKAAHPLCHGARSPRQSPRSEGESVRPRGGRHRHHSHGQVV